MVVRNASNRIRPAMLVAGLALAWCACTTDGRRGGGRLELTVVDAASGEPTPARIEIVDAAGTSHVADGALGVAGDCGWNPAHNWFPWYARVQMSEKLTADVPNPFTGTIQFYVDRPTTIDLPPGTYRLRAFKGIEYEVAEHELSIEGGRPAALRVEMTRWIDPARDGWYSADDHLHIPRPHATFAPMIAHWMQAEDLNVANLLQMGLARDLHITPQRGFGETSIHREGNTLVVSGQENPRTHVLGHSIILGAREYIDFPDAYLAYDRFWSEAARQGAIRGYAHWGLGGADEGLAVWGPERLVDFLEVLGFGLAYYGTWYDMLDLGLRITPTAGTDYPCAPGLPGRERFYTHVDGPLTYASWLEEVRRGRTFVTNGPVLELSIESAGIGDDLILERPGTVDVEGRVRFDPARDDVMALELIGGGEVLHRSENTTETGEIRLSATRQVEASTWFALRAVGTKVGETPVEGIEGLESALTYLERPGSAALLEGAGRVLPRNGDPRPSAAHTAPIYVTVRGTPAIEEQPRAREVARRWLERLDRLEARFADDRLPEMARFPGRGDGLGAEELLAGRPELLRAVERARAIYRGTGSDR